MAYQAVMMLCMMKLPAKASMMKSPESCSTMPRDLWRPRKRLTGLPTLVLTAALAVVRVRGGTSTAGESSRMR